MPGTSTKTKVMMTRLSIEAAAIVERNARKAGIGASAYMRAIIERQVMRKR